MKHLSKGVDLIRRDVRQQRCGNIASNLRIVVRLYGNCSNLASGNLQSILNTLGHVEENLRGRQRRRGYKAILELVTEP